jgi:hypothetical protein
MFEQLFGDTGDARATIFAPFFDALPDLIDKGIWTNTPGSLTSLLSVDATV